MKLLARALAILGDLPSGAAPLPIDALRPIVHSHLATLRSSPTARLDPPRLAIEGAS